VVSIKGKNDSRFYMSCKALHHVLPRFGHYSRKASSLGLHLAKKKPDEISVVYLECIFLNLFVPLLWGAFQDRPVGIPFYEIPHSPPPDTMDIMGRKKWK
jgi:hypothetical protein